MTKGINTRWVILLKIALVKIDVKIKRTSFEKIAINEASMNMNQVRTCRTRVSGVHGSNGYSNVEANGIKVNS